MVPVFFPIHNYTIMQIEQLQKDWRQTYETAQNSAKEHQKAVKAYKEKQQAKGWFPDYDLCAKVTGANQSLYSAYQRLQSVTLELYNHLLEHKQETQQEKHKTHDRIYTGTATFRQSYWQFFFERNGLSTFVDPSCPAEVRSEMIELMTKSLPEVPELSKVIDYLKSI